MGTLVALGILIVCLVVGPVVIYFLGKKKGN